jgi:hypothetical protein
MKTIIQRINELANYIDIKNHQSDIVFNIICQLRHSHEIACKGEYSKQELHDLVFSKNDCLSTDGACDLPKDMLEEISNLQNEIVDAYGFQD